MTGPMQCSYGQMMVDQTPKFDNQVKKRKKRKKKDERRPSKRT